MSLITEINRTETEKNKAKQVATNIDNKLVELGGEQAINLSDVPNKIKGIKSNFKKIYINYVNSAIEFKSGYNFGYDFTISTNFKIEEVFLLVIIDGMAYVIDAETANKANKLHQYHNGDISSYIFYLRKKNENLWNLACQQETSTAGAAVKVMRILYIIAIGG